MEIILASASARRSSLLREWGIPFRAIAAHGVDESAVTGAAAEVATELARRKAEAVARAIAVGTKGRPGRIYTVIGADTVVELDGATLGKPRDREDARAMLGRLAGRTHRVVTGVAVCRPGMAALVESETSDVMFHALSDSQIDAVLATGDWEGKAGAYGIQSEGRSLVAGFRGCYLNIVGLPMRRVIRLLQASGAASALPEGLPDCGCARHPLSRGGEGACPERR